MTGKVLQPIQQHKAQYAVAIMNGEVLADVAIKLGGAPKMIELRPPEALLKAEVGTWPIPVIIYRTESDIAGKTEPLNLLYSVEVIDVDECTDTTLPKKWRHQCNGAYTSCRNDLQGTYHCDCIAGTAGAEPSRGVLSSQFFGSKCKDPMDHIQHRSTCRAEFVCEPNDECAEKPCAAEGQCTDIDCDGYEGLQKTPPTCVGSYSCKCRPGFEGDGHGSETAEGCSNVDECATGAARCQKYSDCIDQTPGPENNWGVFYTCKCREGFQTVGDECIPTELCKLVDDADECHPLATCGTCSSKDDQSVCRDSPKPAVVAAQFKCQCQEHFKGDGFRASEGSENTVGGCVPIDYCTDPVFGHECNADADCINLGGGEYECKCHAGYSMTKGLEGKGTEGCNNINECSDCFLNQCHFGATCVDEVPSEGNSYEGYSCSCKNEEGWVNVDQPCNDHYRGGGYGDMGCRDITPPKAFLRCAASHEYDPTLDDIINQDMQTVFEDLKDRLDTANCDAEYRTQAQLVVEGADGEAGERYQECLCPAEKDHYKQYSQYVEKGMIVKDDNVVGIGALRERINFANLPFETFNGIYLAKVGSYPRAVKYALASRDSNEIVESCEPQIPTQVWYREVEVVPANECEDETLEDIFRHKCHAHALCTDTRERYRCTCHEGYRCEDCDAFQVGWGLSQNADDPAHFTIMRSDKGKGGPGCADHIPPVIGLTGKWPLILPECKCGDGGSSNSSAPSRGVLESHGLNAYAYDYHYEYDAATGISVKTPVPLDVTWGPIERFPCKEIPLDSPVSVEVMGFGNSDAPKGVIVSQQHEDSRFDHLYAVSQQDREQFCDHDPIAYRVVFSAVDEAGNEASPVAHFIVEKKVEVLSRLLALEQKEAKFEQFVKQQEAKMEKIMAAYAEKSGQMAEKLDHVTDEVDEVLMTDHVYLWYIVYVLVALVALVALYFGWIPTALKMLASVLFPQSCSRNDFEEGYDLWLRFTSCGFKGRLDRVRAVERQWAMMEDLHED